MNTDEPQVALVPSLHQQGGPPMAVVAEVERLPDVPRRRTRVLEAV